MVQISRLDSITANNMKSDFISSISHEFRSPLHGILASAEFLHDSELDSTQGELVSTIQTCGSTLLDTINHVLDYSKINSFEKKSPTGALSNELDNISNVALICEDIVNGIMAAREFSSLADSTSLARHGFSQPHDPHPPHESSVEIILDFEKRDWNFKIQPGALRRIIMNIFGNAQKYTETGFILVQLRVKDAERRQANSSLKRGQKMLAMNIIDSGRGMSQQYMERKLYTPFAQEDSFAPGIGLGLSIVRSIVNQLGGKINIRSELGKGTDVEVLLPLEVPEPSAEAPSASAAATYAATSSDVEAAKAVETLRAMAHGKTMAVWRNEATLGDRNRNLSWKTVAAYCRTWFGFTILAGQEPATLAAADLVIKERVTADDDAEAEAAMALSIGEPSRVLILQEQLCRAGGRRGKLATSVSETISMPIGPFKLARCIVALFRERERSGTVGEEEPPSPTDKGQLDGAGSDGVAADEAPRTSSAETTDDVHCEIALPTPPSQDADADPFPTPPSQAADADPLPTPPSQATDTDPLPTPPSQAADTDPLPTPPSQAANTDPLPTPPSQATDADASPLPKRAGSTPFRPDAKKQASPSPSAPLSSPAPSPRPLRILAVDDNSLNLQLLTRYLGRRAQDRVVTARNGVEAVAAVRRGGGEGFDVVFMDISMPAMDGFEATRLIREFEREEEGRGKKGKAYVVALTGLASRRDRDEAVSSGFDEFLTKPIGFGMIGELLGRLSGRVG
jgi:signal transduction histidine kinase/CheY-like chemotaxis protein